MPDEKLVEYIRSQLDNNVSSGTIKANLKKAGWKDKDVKEAFVSAKTHGIPKPEKKERSKPEVKAVGDEKKEVKSEKHSVLDRVSAVMLHPKKYFETIKNEVDYKEPIKYLFVNMLVQIILLVVLFYSIMLIFIADLDISTALFPIALLFLSFVGIMLGIGANMLVSLYFHWFVKLFGGKSDYVQTFKANVYGSTPEFLMFTLIFILNQVWPKIALIPNILFGIWSLVLVVIGVSVLHEMSALRVFYAWISGTGFAIITVLVLFYGFLLVLGYEWFFSRFIGFLFADIILITFLIIVKKSQPK